MATNARPLSPVAMTRASKRPIRPNPLMAILTAIPPPDKKCRKTPRILYKHGLMLIRVILAVNDFMFLAGFSEERVNDIRQ
jgi:hypothetical protein